MISNYFSPTVLCSTFLFLRPINSKPRRTVISMPRTTYPNPAKEAVHLLGVIKCVRFFCVHFLTTLLLVSFCILPLNNGF